jgi:hypothetical protein
MTFDFKVTIFAALSARRHENLANWLRAYSLGVNAEFWAKEITALNDAEAALRKAMPY